MSWFDIYNQRIKKQGQNIAEIQSNTTKNFLLNSFNDSPFYKSIILNDKALDVRIIDTKNSYIKELLFLPDTKISNGDMVTIDNVYWLIYDFIDNELFPKATIWKCNNYLKYRNTSGIIIKIPCFISKDPLAKFGVDYYETSNKYGLTIADGGFYAYVSKNQTDSNIRIGKRFILGDSPYIVVGYNDVTIDGIACYTLSMDLLSESDDLINGIAGDKAENNYRFVVLNGDEINIPANQSIDINVELYNNDILIPDANFVISSLDNIIDINNMSIAGNTIGTATLRIAFNDDASIYKDIIVNVVESLTDDYQLIISGRTSGVIKDKITLNAKLFNNSLEIDDFSVDWQINSTLSKIYTVGDKQCEVILGTEEKEIFDVIATLKSNSNIKATHTIKVTGLWG